MSKLKKDFGQRVMFFTLLFVSLFSLNAWAQTIQLTGTVTDGRGEPLIGASVLEQGTTNGCITDVDGNFTLNVPANATILFSYVGYLPREITLNGQSFLQVTLSEDSEMLEEVIVVGYGTMKKSDMTGAISSVDMADLVKRTTTNPAEALQGKIAGVNVMKTGGNAGASVNVKIRGVKSFGDNAPLYIIDGFPGSIENVNPQDIEAMEVLKDGAAAAIYGSVAANGVIIITTKNGKKGETHFDFSTYLSMTHVAKKLEMLNAEQYKSVIKSMYDNAGMEAPSYTTDPSPADTDWQDAMMRSGFAQNYMFSLRGGGETSQYSVSYNHADEKGIFLGNNFRQDNARMKVHMSKYIFDVDANLGFRYTDSRQPQYSLKEMYSISPLVPIYDDNEPYGYGLTSGEMAVNNNVMADYHYINAYTKDYYTTANAALTVHFAPFLTFKTSYGYRGQHTRDYTHYPDYISNPKQPVLYPVQEEKTSYWEEQVIDNILTFDKSFGKHSLNVMAGSSITATKYTWNSVSVEGKSTAYSVDENGNLVTTDSSAGFLDPSFDTIGAGTGGTYSGDGSKYEYNRASFFGRLNYNYDNRYLLQATFRYDGSSKFGSDNRWGFFPSVAVGWRISEEAFFPKDIVLSNLKLRASWGQLGNENYLGYYDFQALITTYNRYTGGYVQGNGSNAWAGSIAWGMENRSLKWETTDTKNIGLDFGLFDNRLNGNFNYYYNQTRDLLITKELAPSTGLESPTLNVGKIRNTGVEIELNWSDKVKDFEYGIGFNLSTTSNKVLALANNNQALPCTGLKYGTDHFPAYAKVGQPISAFYLYRTDGIFQSDTEAAAYVNASGERLQPEASAGDFRFKDLNGDGVIDEDDKEYCGTGIPKLEANLTFSAAYKGFDFSVVFGSAWGHKLYNGNKYEYESMSSPTNMLSSTLKAWTPQNTHTDVPRAIYNDPNQNSRESDRFLEKGNFVRLRQLQLGYTLPVKLTKKAFIERLRFYVSGENLFTITGYDGIDPEFSSNSILDTGIDRYIYPFTRSYTVGAQLTF